MKSAALLAAIPILAATLAPAKPSWVFSVLGKTKPVAEKTLGKPVAVLDEDELEVSYARKGFTEVGVAYYGKGGTCEALELEFEKDPADWKAALKFLGIDSKNVKAKGGKPQDFTGSGFTYYDLTGIKGMPAKWNCTYWLPEISIDEDGVVTQQPARMSFYGPDAP